MTTTSPTNGNGNGGLTTKEYLARIDSKLDSLQAGLELVRLNFAVHEAKPHHDAARDEIEELKNQAALSRAKLAAYGGGIAVGVFAIELLVRFFN